ncbi:hypothetical protein BH20BAC1_BH20BAC1_08570 [soil metagenome]
MHLKKFTPNKYLLKVIFLVFLCLNFSVILPASGQSVSRKRVTVPQKNVKPKYGTASYYAKKFEGRKTSSGEKYHANKFTAACNVLPLQTWIKVTNLKNNRWVIVQVNDRLHYRNPRLVDLSYAAARQLGYASRGLAKVKVEVLRNYKVPKK